MNYNKMSDGEISVRLAHFLKPKYSAAINPHNPTGAQLSWNWLNTIQTSGYFPLHRAGELFPVLKKSRIALTPAGKTVWSATHESGLKVNHRNPLRAAATVYLMLQDAQASAGAPQNCRSNEKVQAVDRQDVDHVDEESPIRTASVLDSSPKNVESRCGMNSTLVNDDTTGKPLTITLPDISSKAFWSGTGKHEVFHPETYKRWVKEAIERDCTIAKIEVKVK